MMTIPTSLFRTIAHAILFTSMFAAAAAADVEPGLYDASTGIFTSEERNYVATFGAEPSTKPSETAVLMGKHFPDFEITPGSSTSLRHGLEGFVAVDFVKSQGFIAMDEAAQQEMVVKICDLMIEGEESVRSINRWVLSFPGVSCGNDFHVVLEKNGGFELRMRLMISDDTLYFVGAVGKPEFVGSATAKTFLNSFSLLNPTEVPSPSAEPSEASGNTPNLTPFQDSEAGFSILLPSLPEKELADVSSDPSQPQPQVQYSVETEDGSYIVSYQDAGHLATGGPELLQLGFDGARDGLLRGLGGNVVVQEKVMIDDQIQGQLIVIALPESQGALRTQHFVANGRFFQIIAVGTGEFVTGDQTEAVFASFDLLDR